MSADIEARAVYVAAAMREEFLRRDFEQRLMAHLGITAGEGPDGGVPDVGRCHKFDAARQAALETSYDAMTATARRRAARALARRAWLRRLASWFC